LIDANKLAFWPGAGKPRMQKASPTGLAL